ncbi:hypothetical protein D0860_07449 [Hortaea werneckii]|uniref:Shugoshin C-terminal domain-containing protein n=1 Tax=Hortaea werneckii TaxID=91943 RepID=A0A3M7GLD4_HORWE|nr:hypothetical protein D0860_07449 [Hortaea werneckii]
MARLNEPPTAPANHTTSTLAAAGGENVDACATMRTKSRPVTVPPPTDFLEVKRRFIRQNRELAKNNSSQSLRIRSLELEVSRLLSDNLELREKVFRLEGELFTARGKISSDAVRKVKDALLAKIEELSGVVEGLDEAAAEEQEPRSERSVGKPMMEGQWRERQPLAELMRDTQMPTIVEDKLYPRRTLNAEEIQAIRLSGTGSNESPDLGPPPVAHFDYGDPEKAPASPTQMSPSRAGEDDGLPGLSVNLETRRRRKDGQPKLEIRRHSILPQSPEKSDTEPSTMLRTGAKRKLSDREIDQPIKPPTQADFTFSRKGESKAIVAETEREIENETAQQSSVETVQDVATTPSKPVRKVLGDKSVNQSPRKNSAPVTGKANKPGKEESKKPEKPAPKSNPVSARGQSRNRRASNVPQPSPSHDDSNNILPTVEIPPPTADAPTGPPPKTPAAPTDIFSPPPSEPSVCQPSQPETRAGTPPPTDLSTLSTTSTEGGGSAAGASGRPSRRARSAVNYAEPSLVAKMRRPGRGMVDAVTGLQDSRRKSSNVSGVTVTGERKVPVEEQQRKGRKVGEKEEVGDGEVFIKPEPTEDDEEAWKGLPCSSGAGEEEVAVKKEEEEKQGVAHPSGDSEEAPHTHASSTNLTAPDRKDNTRLSPTDHPDSNEDKSRRRKRLSLHQQQPNTSTNTTDETLQTTTSKLAELDLYDFKDPSFPPSTATSPHLPKAPSNPPKKGRTPSSSISSSTSASLTMQQQQSQQQKRTHRRHSSVSRDLDRDSHSAGSVGASAGAGAGSGTGVGGMETSATGSAGKGSTTSSAAERVGGSGSSAGSAGSGGTAAGRRRSMML